MIKLENADDCVQPENTLVAISAIQYLYLKESKGNVEVGD